MTPAAPHFVLVEKEKKANSPRSRACARNADEFSPGGGEKKMGRTGVEPRPGKGKPQGPSSSPSGRAGRGVRTISSAEKKKKRGQSAKNLRKFVRKKGRRVFPGEDRRHHSYDSTEGERGTGVKSAQKAFNAGRGESNLRAHCRERTNVLGR